MTENERRNAIVYAKFNPITGEGSVGKRVKCTISDFPIHTQWLPERIMKVPLVRQLIEAGSISKFLTDYMGVEDNQDDRLKVIEQFVRIRSREDFPFWAATFVYIKAKGGGEDVLFRLTRPQRRFVDRLEKLRIAGKPIRIILLKARQWGGSTSSQLYMAWLQLLHKTGLNSLIIAHQGAGSDEIKDMFDRMIKSYPVEMLYKIDEAYNENEPKIKALVAALQSQQVKDFMDENYKGAVVSAVENPTDGYDASVDYDALNGETVSCAATPAPHCEVLEVCKEILAAKGITLDIQEYDDYIIPNNVVEDGTVDTNYFQHQPYLDDFNTEHGTHLVTVAGIHVEPMGIYGGKQDSLAPIEG